MSVSKSLSCSLVAVAMALLTTQGAQAAQNHSRKASKTKARPAATASTDDAEGIEEAAATIPGQSGPSQSGTSAIETNITDTTNTSTAGLAKAIEAAAPRKVFGEFYTETFENMTEVKEGTGTPTFAAYGGVKYDLGNARSLSLRQNFMYESAGKGSSDTRGFGNFHIDDTVINYTDGKFASFWKDGSIIMIARTYVPTGEKSRFVTHQAGKERLYFFETKSFGKWDLTLVQLGQFFHWTQDSWRDAKGEEQQSNWFALTNEFDAFYNFNPVVSVGFIAGADTLWNRPLAGKDSRADDFYIQPTLQVVPKKGITTQLYIYNEVNTRSPSQSFALMRDDETQVWANVAVSL